MTPKTAFFVAFIALRC